MIRSSWRLALPLAVLVAMPAAATTSCFPTCAPDDGRFLIVEGGHHLRTLSAVPLKMRLVPPQGADSFVVGIFDGDCGGTDAGGRAHWDVSDSPTRFSVRPCYDLDCGELGPERLAFESTAMPDNAWFEFVVPVEPGDEAFRLTVVLPPNVHDRMAANQFKVRTEGRLVLGGEEQPFAFMAGFTSFDDVGIVYPRYDHSTWNDFDHHMRDARYDGVFTIRQEVVIRDRSRPLVLQLWNGDLDRGSWDGTDLDTDDPDTPSDVIVHDVCPEEYLPPFYRRPDMLEFARSVVCSEGVAHGREGTTGAPADEGDPNLPLTGAYAGFNRYSCRPPSVFVEHEGPDGSVWVDSNPSGNREWERFCISEVAILPPPLPGHSEMRPDIHVAELSAGVYTSRVRGMDHNNLNAWYCGCTVVDDEGAGPAEPEPLCPAEPACDCTVLGAEPEGCTPGYWKNHLGSWALFEPTDSYDEVFGIYSSTNPTLWKALKSGGGGEYKLMRHATAALLNVGWGQQDYYYGMAEVIRMVREAYSTGSFETVAERFVTQNEIGCDEGRD